MTARRTVADRFGRFQFATRLVSDSLMVLLAWFSSYYLRFFVFLDGEGDETSTLLFSVLSLLALIATIFFNYVYKLYEPNMTSNWRVETGALVKTSVSLFVTFVIFYYFCFNLKISRVHLVMFGGMSFCFLDIGRYICNCVFASHIKAGEFKANVLLVGTGKNIIDYYNATLTASEAGRLRVVAQYLGNDVKGIKSIKARNLADAVAKAKADVVVIAYDDENSEMKAEIRKEALELFEQQVYFLPDLPKSYVGTTISDFHYIPLLEVNCHDFTFGKRFIKRTFDIISSLFGIILLSPFYIVIAILIKITSKGPVLFKQERVTRDGAVFNMLKFRSMRIDMPEQGGAHWTEENDPRITKVGRILRKTSLDEIPQFFNVLMGTMSLIGPRPERPELVEQFEKEIPGYNMRHRVKAGISGWAQVNGFRGNTSLEKRIDFDLYYIRNWTPWLDIKIVVLTFVKGFVNKNAY
ncbi:MAG: exopolysaccharide biosynthesis polyprenyl glycosylphosphotransferase [Sphaerochaetaceae bacterium]|nr:exopolysaccharide biosynthesis polyprenyl glycosylphosphotransferase [Sphaerochaetaceae bacterium]